jgi:hypothetical protein
MISMDVSPMHQAVDDGANDNALHCGDQRIPGIRQQAL